MRGILLAATLALVSATVPALAHDHKEAKAAPGGGDVRTEILRQLEDAEKKIMALAEAMPTEKYAWRPGEEIRSTGEVFMHVVGGNYFLPTFWGVKPGEGVNPRGFEKDVFTFCRAIFTDSNTERTPAASVAQGFSQNTCLPASTAAFR